MQLKFLYSNSPLIGRFVQVKGTVVRVNPVQTPPSVLTFRCLRCNQILVLTQPNCHYTPPKKCSTPNCGSKQFSADRTSPETQLRNRQLIRYTAVKLRSIVLMPTYIESKKLMLRMLVFRGHWIVNWWMIWLRG